MQFDDGKKVFEIEYSHMINSNCYDLAVFTLKMTKPVVVEDKFDIHDINKEKGVTGLRFSKYSNVSKAYNFNGNVLLKMPTDALEFINKIQNEKVEELKKAAQKDPEKWYWALGGDTMNLYITSDLEGLMQYREDLKKIEETLENTIHWNNNPLEAVSTKIDRKTCLYTETGWFEVSHADIMRIYNEIIAKKNEKKTEIKNKEAEFFQKAKETGVKQLIEKYTVECSDPREECDIDIVAVYAMPDGSKQRIQNHTW